MQGIDLNSDLGESFGGWKMGMDEEVMGSISSSNVACGWHAGDPMVMVKTVRAAKDRGVAVVERACLKCGYKVEPGKGLGVLQAGLAKE